MLHQLGAIVPEGRISGWGLFPAEDLLDDTVPGEARIGKPVASAEALGAPHNQQRTLLQLLTPLYNMLKLSFSAANLLGQCGILQLPDEAIGSGVVAASH